MRSAGLIFQCAGGHRRAPHFRQICSAGPVGIAQMSGQAAKQGPSAFIMLMSMVSLNLAVINLMPLPILDGGGVVMLIIEMVMRRDMSMPVKEAVFKVGFVFIMMLVAFVLYNDITKILPRWVASFRLRQSSLSFGHELYLCPLHGFAAHQQSVRGLHLPSRSRPALLSAHPRRTFETIAREMRFPPERRAALVAALRQQNGDSPRLDLLAREGTVAVVTGQQVGLFSGPAYTIYKALTAVKLARSLDGTRHPGRAGLLAGHRRSRLRRSQSLLGVRRRAPSGQAGEAALAGHQPARGPVCPERAARRGIARGAGQLAVWRRGFRAGGGNLPTRPHHGRGVQRAAPAPAGAIRAAACRSHVAGHARVGRAGDSFRAGCRAGSDRRGARAQPRAGSRRAIMRRSTWRIRPPSSSCWRTAAATRCAATAAIICRMAAASRPKS